MKKMVLIMAMAALVCWLPGQAMADTFTSTLGVLGTHDSGFNNVSNYGNVIVNRAANGLSATVTFTPLELATGDYDFVYDFLAGQSVFLNVRGAFTASLPASESGFLQWDLDGPGTASTFGNFNLTADHNLLGSVDSFVVNLTNTSGTPWANAASVLASNGLGFDAAAQFFEDNVSGDPTGFVAERAVPIPPTALLMGSGLLGLVGFGWRRKRS
jgi:hypothetical protein